MNGAVMFIPGALFGIGLVISGMTNPAKVIGVLDVTGQWDPTLLVVMAGALAVFAPLNYFIRKNRTHALSGDPVSPYADGTFNLRLLGGATLFGIGWGLSGVCPGPALTGLGAGHASLFAFVPGLAIGVIIAQRLFNADAPETN